MIRRYRSINKGEFFVVFGDCAQGGEDSNFVTCLSKTQVDIPIVFQMQGVAAAMTPVLHQLLEWIYDKTEVKPVVALERQNGGVSEMERLMQMNKNNKYTIYFMKNVDGSTTDKLGWSTDTISRPRMIGDWKEAYDTRQVTIYDKAIVEQHQTFITNKNGRPQAAPNTHDDAVMSAAGAWQLYQTENPEIPLSSYTRREHKRLKLHVS